MGQGLVKAGLAEVVTEAGVQAWTQGFLSGLDGFGNLLKSFQVGRGVSVTMVVVSDDPETLFQESCQVQKFHGVGTGVVGPGIRRGGRQPGLRLALWPIG